MHFEPPDVENYNQSFMLTEVAEIPLERAARLPSSNRALHIFAAWHAS